jgi:DNA (cytosine-5)-methyltransferase 1
VIKAKTPKVFVAENVKGLRSANHGEAFPLIFKELWSIPPGYNVSAKLYNFADYGVPQHRERLIMVGIRSDLKLNCEHPEPTHGPGRLPYVTSGQALAGVEKVIANNSFHKCSAKVQAMLEQIPEGGNFSSLPKSHPLYIVGLLSSCYRRLHRDKVSPTIIGSGGGGSLGYHFKEPRPLTNRERARLQSFPDDFIFNGSITSVRKQIGNAVPPEGIRPLARCLLSIF